MTGEARGALVVGGGLAGLACARDLRRAGWRVTVLEGAREVGGRAATHALPQGERLDSGAQSFTARSERLQTLVAAGLREGWLRQWTRGFPLWQAGEQSGGEDGHPRYAPPAGMAALARQLGRDLEVVTEATVTSLSRTPEGWTAHTAGGEAYRTGALLLALPAPQLLPLLDGLNVGEAAGALARVRFEPGWTLLLGLAQDLEVPWKGLQLEGHPALRWIARDHTRRPPGAPPSLVLHATPQWSRAHLDLPREAAAVALLAAAHDLIGSPRLRWSLARRWRFATPTQRFEAACHWDGGLHLGWCGDWCTPDPGAPRVEAALLSGWALARQAAGRSPGS